MTATLVSVTGHDTGETGAICLRADLSAGGKIKSPKDLEGEQIGTPFGSFAYRQALTWAYENGIKPNLADQSIEAQLAGLKDKKLAAAVTWEPYPSFMEQRGIATRWLTGLEMPCTCKKHFPGGADHTFRTVGSTLAIFDWLRDRPDSILGYLKSEEECRDMLTNNADLAAFHIWTDIGGHHVWSDITEIHPGSVRVTLDMMVWDGRITPECRNHIKGVARMWKDAGFLTGKRSENPDQYVDSWGDDRILRMAIKELKAQGRWTSDTQPGFPSLARVDQSKQHSWKSHENIKLEEKPWQPTKS